MEKVKMVTKLIILYIIYNLMVFNMPLNYISAIFFIIAALVIIGKEYQFIIK